MMNYSGAHQTTHYDGRWPVVDRETHEVLGYFPLGESLSGRDPRTAHVDIDNLSPLLRTGRKTQSDK